MADLAFPAGFTWGVATASYQIEGGATEGGRGATIWDVFSDTPGKVRDGDTGDVACDHYHLWRSDIGLIKALNVSAYRFSIAWSRIFPNGRGQVNQAGIDFYSNLVDGLLAAGITPFVTLYHWDLPQALQEEGGWTRRGIVDDFVAYAETVINALGDRVKHWITFNEPWVFTWVGYVMGRHAPGYMSDVPTPALAGTHHLLLSHGKTVRYIHDNFKDAHAGITLNLNHVDPATNRSADQEAAARHDGYVNRWYLDPIFRGHYPADMLELWEEYMPEIHQGDMQTIHAPIEFLGVNNYFRDVVEDDPNNTIAQTRKISPEGEYTEMGWEVYPQGFYALLKRLHNDYNPRAIYITENGAAFKDEVSANGQVHDDRRVAYLKAHFEAAHHAMQDGVPLKGYFVWSLMDNFEWAEGYSKRFGVYYVDYDSPQKTRILKDSGKLLAEIAAKSKR
jgi:beta-glucosidase